VQLLAEEGITDIVVFGGGIIPDDDVATLKEAGLAGIFTPGASLSEITDWVAQHVEEH
jgi:methylmalonyl-CoA mutase C-terminal domain/subunit